MQFNKIALKLRDIILLTRYRIVILHHIFKRQFEQFDTLFLNEVQLTMKINNMNTWSLPNSSGNKKNYKQENIR